VKPCESSAKVDGTERQEGHRPVDSGIALGTGLALSSV
jgi:hypothetical protein